MATVLPFTQYTEAVVGLNHPTLADTDNRAFRQALQRSGFGADSLFDGFPMGNSVVNAGSSDFTGTADVRVNAAIARAVAASPAKKYVFVPNYAWDGLAMLPYNASLVSFNTAVRMIAEGTNPSVLETKSYGAALNGTTDDAVAIQAMLTAGAGSIVRLSPGNSKCTAVLTASANCLISGYGMGVSTITFPTNGLAAELCLRVLQVSNVTLQDFTLRETGSTRSGVYGLLHISGANLGPDTKGTLAKNIRVYRVECDGSSGTGMMVQYASDMMISHCFIHNGFADGIHVQRGATDITVTNNDCENNGDDDIAFVSHNPNIYSHVERVIAANNRVGDQNATLNLGAGIKIAGAIGATITGNLIRNTRAASIVLQDQDDTGAAQGRTMGGRIVVVGNELYNAGLSGVGVQDGISGSNVRDVLIADNVIFSPNRIGISFVGAYIDISIRGNRIRNCVTGRGIDLEPTNSVDANVLTLWTDALLTDGESKANVCAHRICVQDNSVGTTSTDGIYLVAPVGNPFDGLVCTGNEVWNSNKSNAGGIRGILVQNATNANVRDNQVRAGYAGNAIQTLVLLSTVTKTGLADYGSDVIVLSDLAAALDVSLGSLFVSTVTAAKLVGAPFWPTNGQRITFTIIQDGTGGRTVAWNAVFKQSWSDTGNTLNKRSSISFIYDGTSWNQDGAQTAYV